MTRESRVLKLQKQYLGLAGGCLKQSQEERAFFTDPQQKRNKNKTKSKNKASGGNGKVGLRHFCLPSPSCKRSSLEPPSSARTTHL